MAAGLPGRTKKGVKQGMTPQAEFLELIKKTVEKNCSLDTPVSLKELPAAGGLYAELGEGFGNATYYYKSTEKTLPVLFLCRHADQKRGLEELSDICGYLQRLKRYPQGETFAWLDTEIAKEPNKIGRDEDGVYHFSCILNCKIYY